MFFFQAEDGIRDLVRSRGLGDVYKRQGETVVQEVVVTATPDPNAVVEEPVVEEPDMEPITCLLYTSDAADERSSVDLGGRRIIKKKK